jgi:FKBP-type peptidyl-prolyl cis-trans isomerase (trigger factor)
MKEISFEKYFYNIKNMKYTINKEKNSKLELEVTIEATEFMAHWDNAIKRIQKEAQIDGFRKGSAPVDAIVSKYGEMSVLQEMTDLAINKSYPEVIIKEKIHVIGEPHIHIVTLEKNKDFVYHAHVPVYPVIELPDYKKIATDTAKEINANPEKLVIDTTDEELANIMKGLSDEIKSTTPDLETKIKDNLKLEKGLMLKNEIRAITMENLVTVTDEKNPDCWPENFKDEDKAQIVAIEISKKENIKLTEEEIDAEVIKLMMHIPYEEVANGKIDEERVKAYAVQIITNERMFVSLGI